MENTAEIIRDLANLYGIEILDTPSSHVLVDSNGIERPLELTDFKNVFGLATSDFFNSSKASSMIQEVQTAFKISDQKYIVLNSPELDSCKDITNNQYAMAA